MRPIALLIGLVACVHPHEDHPHTEREGPHWTYEGHDGPAVWGALDPGFRNCARGHNQSPIDLDLAHAEHGELPPLAYHYGPARVVELDNGHTIQDNVPPGEYAELAGKRYTLEQFHFHHPSEHTLGGVRFPLEIHLVHRGAGGKLLVIGVFVSEGTAHPALRELFDHLPAPHASTRVSIDPAGLLPPDLHYVTYEGSLTTPPCSEGVTWLVLSTPIEASTAQIDRFAGRYPHNSRPVMPRHGRAIRADP